jgi:hypothetical protein
MKKCISLAPSKIEYIDFFALQHTGGIGDLDDLAEYAILNKGLKPEIMITIGCYDDPGKMTHPDDTLGQAHTSWAVHYYLSNLITKRLRGIPVQDAAHFAFGEGTPLNLVNPISIGALFVVGSMEDSLLLGYWGSKPTQDTERKLDVKSFLKYSLDTLEKEIGEVVLPLNNQEQKLTLLKKICTIEKLNEYLEEHKEHLKRKELKALRDSKEKIQALRAALSV